MVKFNSRRLMEQAFGVMGQSVVEARPNGKASPQVGVVLWKPDGNIETACRGELRDGDHAELTESERNGWQWLSTKVRASSADYATAMQFDVRTARRHLNRFVELGLARKTGSGPSTQYEVL